MSQSDLERAVAALAGAGPVDRLEAIWLAYERENGRLVSRPPSDAERASVAAWLSLRAIRNDESFSVYRRAVRFLAYRTIGEKASSLAQGECGRCETVVGVDGAVSRSVYFPVNVDPWSAQAAKAGRVAIRDAVKNELSARSWAQPITDPVCLTVCSVVPSNRRVMDVDNLVKGLLDAMIGILYKDDRQIQCLTTRRVTTAAHQGMYSVQARAVEPYTADVVYDDVKPVRIMSGRRIAP